MQWMGLSVRRLTWAFYDSGRPFFKTCIVQQISFTDLSDDTLLYWVFLTLAEAGSE